MASPVIIVLSVVVTAVLYCSRSGDAVVHPQLVAEDGAVFFTEARTFGLGSLLVPYSGYLHLIPRTVALAANLLPAASAPAFYLAASVGIVIWSAATIATAGHPYAWLLAPLCMLVPGGDEIFGTLTNVQWLAQAALVLVTLSPTPSSRAIRTNQLAITLTASLSGPFSIFVSPLAVWRIVAHKGDRYSWLLAGLVLAAALVQISFVLGEASPYEGTRNPLHLLPTMLDRWVGQMTHVGLTDKPVRFRQDLFMLGAILLAFVFGPRNARMLYIYAGVVMAATFVRFVPASDYFDVFWNGERYFYMPRLIVLWSLVLALLKRRWYSLVACLALVLVGNSFDHWHKGPYPVLPWRSEAWRIDQGQAVRIITNPSSIGDTSPAWAVKLPAMP